jgi:ribosome-associated protein
MIEIDDSLVISANEIEYTFSTSSKPGGQNVNKVSSRVTLRFDVGASPSLSDDQRRLILSHLRTRITKDGVLRVMSQKYRSQRANREAALARFVELLRNAIKPRPKRKPTRVPTEVREQRLRDKKKRGLLKRTRSRLDYEGD